MASQGGRCSLASLLVQKAISRAPEMYAKQAAAMAASVTEPLLEVVADARVERWQCKRPPQTSEEETSIRTLATRATCRLLCACALAAGFDAQAVAHLLLLQLYRAIKFNWGALVAEAVLVPFVLRFCGPREWVRCASASRKFKDLGVGRQDVAAYWLKSFCRDGHAEVLDLAVQKNVPTLLRSSIAAGGNINFAFEMLWYRTPLHRAAMRGNLDMCRLLLELQADASLRDSHGAAPIHLVASRGRLPTLELLIQHDPGSAMVVDMNGRTPCHMAALKGHTHIIKHLFERRAHIGAQDRAHRTPSDMARRGQFWDLLRFIEALQEQLPEPAEDAPEARLSEVAESVILLY